MSSTHRDESAHAPCAPYRPRKLPRLQVVGARRGYHAVVEKYEYVCHAQIRQRVARGSIEPGEEQGRDADGEDYPTAVDDQEETATHAYRQCRKAGPQHLPLAHLTFSQRALEARPAFLVGTPHEVVVVVDKIGQYLQRQSADDGHRSHGGRGDGRRHGYQRRHDRTERGSKCLRAHYPEPESYSLHHSHSRCV